MIAAGEGFWGMFFDCPLICPYLVSVLACPLTVSVSSPSGDIGDRQSSMVPKIDGEF